MKTKIIIITLTVFLIIVFGYIINLNFFNKSHIFYCLNDNDIYSCSSIKEDKCNNHVCSDWIELKDNQIVDRKILSLHGYHYLASKVDQELKHD